MIGKVLGNRYELIEKIGEGGMSIVYKGKCQILNRYVSVKILKKEYSSDPDFLKKFKREATAVASLSDNNIVNIYDVGSEGDINYIVMEYVKGQTLKQIIKQQGKLSTDEALKIGIQIGKALEHAHKNNIIHRDIKPHNVLVTSDGVLKVTDFGIAKSSDSATITNASKVMGSAHYFSPEQAKGNVVDCRTDIYSLGIVLYELVTGRVPFDAESPVSVALKHIQEPVVPPKEINENIPDSLNRLILKAIEKEPIRRYQNITDMVNDMKSIQRNKELNIIMSDYDQDATRILDSDEVNKKLDMLSPKRSRKNNGSIDTKKKNLRIAILILLVIVSISGIFVFSQLTGKSGEVKVPQITGLKQDDAEKLVKTANLKFVLVGTEKSSQPAGTVIRCYPEVGTKVKVNSDVRVSISGGLTGTGIPNVKNVQINSAQQIITDSGFTVGNITYAADDSIQKDYVISQTPDPESNDTTDKSIDLVVSTGAAQKYVVVPDLHGKTLEQATAMLANVNLKLGTKEPSVTDSESLKNTIKSQNIDPGQSVMEGSAISVTYYFFSGDLTTVPNIRYVDGAEEQLISAGLTLGKMTAKDTNDESLDGKVISTNPSEGSKVETGTKVNITYWSFK
ncbi:MAG: Stk1 family PASTA domain-containing Ser/Thr kinase [Clostridiaceae bacterium]